MSIELLGAEEPDWGAIYAALQEAGALEGYEDYQTYPDTGQLSEDEIAAVAVEEILGRGFGLMREPGKRGRGRLPLSARMRPVRTGRRAARGHLAIRRSPPMTQQAPGVNMPSAKETLMGVGTAAWTAASTSTIITLTAWPDVPFRPRRPVVNIERSGAAGIAVTIRRLAVANVNMMASGTPVPATMLGPLVENVRQVYNVLQPYTRLYMDIAVSAIPAGADTITVDVGLFGDSIGA